MENQTNYDNNPTPYGPYRATKLWNDVIQAFRAGVTCGRHRRYMRTYEDCFTASSATDWLHDYLKNNPNFASNVIRSQTVQLLHKLYKAKVFEDVGGSKNGRGQVADNGRLYRFTCRSPAKSMNRVPLSCRSDLINHEPRTELVPSAISKCESPPMVVTDIQPHQKLEECHLVAKKLAASDIEEIWTDITIDRLKTILGVADLDDILDSTLVSGKNIMHNCTFVNKNGVVNSIEPKDQLPPWALSAMKCLARWPEKFDDKLPSYPGFEKDVFRVVKDYFCAQPEPLMTYELFEVITNIFTRGDERCTQQQSNAKLCQGLSQSVSFKSVENFLLDLTSDAIQSCSNPTEDHSDCHTQISASALDLSPVEPSSEMRRMYRTRSLANDLIYNQTRYETAFGPENQTVTRVYYANGTYADLQYNEPGTFKTVINHHFTSSPKPVNFVESKHHCQATYGVNYAHVRSIKEKRKSTSDTPCVTSHIRKETYGCVVAIVRPRYRSTTVDDHVYSEKQSHCHENSVYYSANMSVVSDQSIYGTPPSTSNQFVPHSSLRSDPPKYQYPPCYNSVFPNGHKSSANDNKKQRRRSSSGPSVPKQKQDRTSDCYVSQALLPKKYVNVPDSVPYRSMSMSDLTVNSAFTSNLAPKSRTCSTKSLHTEDEIEQNVKALQIVCLLLPPANRRKLQLLMRLVAKMVKNTDLCLDNTQSTNNLVLQTFYRAILCSQDEAEMDKVLVKQIVSFLMDNHLEILSTPVELKTWVEERKCLKRTQVSSEDYEKHKLSNSQQALVNLLDEIVSNPVMSYKDKKKRLKQFQKSYPDLYAKRFPNKERESGSAFGKPKIKPPLLVKPLMKLKGLRI